MNQTAKGEPAYLIRKDDVQDVALIAVMSAPGPHPIAHLSPAVPLTGDMVHIVGHTLGIPYAYSPGFVDGIRQMFAPEIGIAGEFVQVWGGAYGGNSGGGLWDLDGRLLGVTSFRAGPLHWFVSGNAIRAFLNG
jgi:S1-C subfamily serine protease